MSKLDKYDSKVCWFGGIDGKVRKRITFIDNNDLDIQKCFTAITELRKQKVIRLMGLGLYKLHSEVRKKLEHFDLEILEFPNKICIWSYIL